MEDEYLIALDLADEITIDGAKAIGPVATLKDALNLIADAGLDAAVIDIKLNGEMAFPVVDVLAERHIPFVFITAHVDPGDVPARHAKVRCPAKPFSPDAISSALEAAISAEQE